MPFSVLGSDSGNSAQITYSFQSQPIAQCPKHQCTQTAAGKSHAEYQAQASHGNSPFPGDAGGKVTGDLCVDPIGHKSEEQDEEYQILTPAQWVFVNIFAYIGLVGHGVSSLVDNVVQMLHRIYASLMCQRTHLAGAGHAVVDRNVTRRLREAGDERIVNTFMDVVAAGRNAALPGVAIFSDRRHFRKFLYVDVVEYDDGRVAALGLC